MLLNGYGPTFKKQKPQGLVHFEDCKHPHFWTAHWHDPCPFPQNITIAASKKIKKNPTQSNSGKLNPRFWILGFLSLNPQNTRRSSVISPWHRHIHVWPRPEDLGRSEGRCGAGRSWSPAVGIYFVFCSAIDAIVNVILHCVYHIHKYHAYIYIYAYAYHIDIYI